MTASTRPKTQTHGLSSRPVDPTANPQSHPERTSTGTTSLSQDQSSSSAGMNDILATLHEGLDRIDALRSSLRSIHADLLPIPARLERISQTALDAQTTSAQEPPTATAWVVLDDSEDPDMPEIIEILPTLELAMITQHALEDSTVILTLEEYWELTGLQAPDSPSTTSAESPQTPQESTNFVYRPGASSYRSNPEGPAAPDPRLVAQQRTHRGS